MFKVFFSYDNFIIVNFSVEHSHFQSRQRRTSITVGKFSDCRQHVIINLNFLLPKTSWVFYRASQEFCKFFDGQSFQHKHFASGQQSSVHFKGRIFSSSPYQNYTSFFYKRKKCVLLSLVESMYFIDKYYCLSAKAAVGFCLLHHRPYLFDTAGNGRKVDKFRFCSSCYYPC